MQRRLGLPTISALALFWLAPVTSQAMDEDSQIWIAATLNRTLSDNVFFSLEGQARISDDASRLGQALLRPSVSYRFGSNTTTTLGYAYVFTDPLGPAKTDEHRLWQQVSFRAFRTDKGLTLTARSRFEQRWVDGADGTGWRLRQQLRLTRPLSDRVTAVAWSEAFVALNDTPWGQKSGVERWRNSVGLSLPLSETVTIEPGYIRQWVRRPAQNRVDHIANLSLSAKF